MSVREWPSYLLNGIPAEVRAGIEQDADENGESLSEVIRQILCAHYDLECEPVERFSNQTRIDGTRNFHLRVHPDLFHAIKMDAGLAGTSYGTAYGGMRKRIIEILSEHYERNPHD